MKFTDIVKGKVAALTGSDIKQSIEGYSKVYGEILLGIHRDVHKNRRLMEEYKLAVAQTSRTVTVEADKVTQCAKEVSIAVTQANQYRQDSQASAREASAFAAEALTAKQEAERLLPDLQSKLAVHEQNLGQLTDESEQARGRLEQLRALLRQLAENQESQGRTLAVVSDQLQAAKKAHEEFTAVVEHRLKRLAVAAALCGFLLTLWVGVLTWMTV